MTFNDIANDHSLVHTTQGKQIILDTVAQYPYMTLAQIFAVWAGIQNTLSVAALRYTVPNSALCYPPQQKQEEVQIMEMEDIESTENNIDLAAPYMTENQGAVSETLGKILAAQRKFDDAIEVYEKLCLKNPEKSAYFAECIAELKAQKTKNN